MPDETCLNGTCRIPRLAPGEFVEPAYNLAAAGVLGPQPLLHHDAPNPRSIGAKNSAGGGTKITRRHSR